MLSPLRAVGHIEVICYVGRVKVLVTGATGFLGGAIARRFLAGGDEVHALARDAERAKALADAGAKVFAGTIGDPNDVLAAAKTCEIVVHAAALVSDRSDPQALEWVNVAGTENVLNAARHAGASRLVYVSCADVTLANRDRVHWGEKHALTKPPVGAHARTKQLAEEIVLAANGTGIETTALRPAIPWGPGDTTTLPRLVREARAGGLRVYGDGTNLISTTYVDNFVDAVLTAAEVTAAAGNAYYVADGDFLDAAELLSSLAKTLSLPAPKRGPSVAFAYALASVRGRSSGDAATPAEVLRWGRSIQLDTQNARRDLEWEPKVALREGMEALAKWVEEVGGLDAVARMGRAPATASDVSQQIALAGGDEA